jgi:hypothetical protein
MILIYSRIFVEGIQQIIHFFSTNKIIIIMTTRVDSICRHHFLLSALLKALLKALLNLELSMKYNLIVRFDCTLKYSTN